MKSLVATFNEERPARLLRDRFEKAGIAAKFKDDYFLQRCIFFVKPAATKKVYVDINEFDHARGLLRDWDRQEHVLDNAVRCPECHSARIEYPQYTRKFITPLVIEWLISFGAEKDYYCMDCHYTWPKEVKPQPDLDVLGFPRPDAHKKSRSHT
ncbi:MAG TPA: hypothetical protein VFZ59_18380 [Verrucomicrobiae bacterium]|nr:hypothetical protein [Verrucomicrobiae bacterium]